MNKIAVIGLIGASVFLNVDRFGDFGETVRALDIFREAGGKGFNQAVAASKFGAEVSFLSAVNVMDVQYYKKICASYNVSSTLCAKAENTAYAVILTDANADNRVYVYHGAQLSASDVNSFSEQIALADVLLLSNEVPQIVNETAIKIAKRNNVKVVYNPAPKLDMSEYIIKNVDLFTPNEYEYEYENVKRQKNVVVTLGDKGCKIVESGITIPAVKVKAIDTTGSGDTFNGVLCACLANKMQLIEGCDFANVASAIKVTRRHVIDAIPTKKEIEDFKEK